jgi:hypothetical protein
VGLKGWCRGGDDVEWAPNKGPGSETKEEFVEFVNEWDKVGAPGDEAMMLVDNGLSSTRSMDSSSELYAEGAEKKAPDEEPLSLPSKSMNGEG